MQYMKRLAILGMLILTQAGCPAIDVWRPPAPTAEEYERGLIVLYPGSSNLHIEMWGFYTGLREAGIDFAMEVRPWGTLIEHDFNPVGAQERFTERAKAEAQRVAEYVRAHPNAPVTLMTFSGGAVFALQVGRYLPDDAPVDRIVVMSPGIYSGFDVASTLDHVTQGVISYYSPEEKGVLLIAAIFGTADGYYSDPAAAVGFELDDPRLMQIPWTPEMAAYGNNGEHLEYFFNIPWIRHYVPQWVATTKVAAP